MFNNSKKIFLATLLVLNFTSWHVFAQSVSQYELMVDADDGAHTAQEYQSLSSTIHDYYPSKSAQDIAVFITLLWGDNFKGKISLYSFMVGFMKFSQTNSNLGFDEAFKEYGALLIFH